MKKSKKISYILRHDPSGLDMDKHGWVLVEDLLKLVQITKEELDFIVAENDKKRFSYSEDGLKIRARQGHSIQVDVELKVVDPPKKLYHGTADRFVQSIQKSGLIKGSRLHVHLSDNVDTAKSVGSRHGKPVIFEVDSWRMRADGIKFYQSENGVWLTDFVDSKYLKLVN